MALFSTQLTAFRVVFFLFIQAKVQLGTYSPPFVTVTIPTLCEVVVFADVSLEGVTEVCVVKLSVESVVMALFIGEFDD